MRKTYLVGDLDSPINEHFRKNYVLRTTHRERRHILRGARNLCLGDSPMNKIAEIVLTALVLAGLYAGTSMNFAPTSNPVIRANQAMLVADGTDPMPLCRRCK